MNTHMHILINTIIIIVMILNRNEFVVSPLASIREPQLVGLNVKSMYASYTKSSTII